MKNTTFRHLMAVGSLSLGGLTGGLYAEGPADLQALAEKARAEASDAVKDAAQAAEEAADKAVAAVEKAAPAAKAAPVDPAKRAEALGLIATLSNDVAAVTTLTNGERLWGEVEESKMGEVLLELLAENEVDLTDPDGPASQVTPLFAEEFLFAVGKEASLQTKNLMALNNLNEQYQTALMLRMMAMEDGGMMMGEGPFASLMAAIQENPDFLVNLVSKSEMPPILLAARVSDDETRDEYAAMLEMGAAQALEMAGEEAPFLKAAKAEVAGITFNGLRVDGKEFIAMADEEMELKEGLSNFVDPAAAQDMINTLQEKDLVLLGGVSDDAIYLYLGRDAKKIPLVAKPAESLAASEHFAFVDSYLDEALVNVLWMDEELLEASAAGQPILGNYIKGMQMGLKDNVAFGDTAKFMKLLEKAQGLESKYLAQAEYQATGVVSFLKGDGLYTEAYGSVVDYNYDWTAAHQLGASKSDSFLTVQGVTNQKAAELSTEYAEVAFETMYEAMNLLGEMDEEPFDIAEVLEGFDLFDTKMKTDALALWKGMSASGNGLGNEFLFEFDLAGSWPTVPGVPQEIIDDGLAPRLSLVYPVTDRSQLADSWKEIEAAASNLLKTASEMAGENIPMQKPMSSSADSLKTWFFPIPMQTDDFAPSITLDDEVMIMSTSKERAVELGKTAKKDGSGETGIVFEMNFEPLQAFLQNYLEIVASDPEMLTEPDAIEFYEENKETIEELVKALDEFASFSSHTRMEGGEYRYSSHLKTK